MKTDPRTVTRNKSQPNIDMPGAIDRAYSDQAGALKVNEVGGKLEPIVDPNTSPGGTTTCSGTARKVGMGATMAIFNPTSGILWATFGGSDVTLQTAGAVVAGNEGLYVAIPLQVGWNRYNSFEHDWLITSAGVYTYVVNDDTDASDKSSVR